MSIVSFSVDGGQGEVVGCIGFKRVRQLEFQAILVKRRNAFNYPSKSFQGIYNTVSYRIVGVEHTQKAQRAIPYQPGHSQKRIVEYSKTIHEIQFKVEIEEEERIFSMCLWERREFCRTFWMLFLSRALRSLPPCPVSLRRMLSL